MANIARDGAPKAPQPIVAHGGMSHQTKDGLAAGISRTQSAAALDGDKLPTDRPAVGKRLDPVALHPGMTARQHAEFVDDLPELTLGEIWAIEELIHGTRSGKARDTVRARGQASKGKAATPARRARDGANRDRLSH